MFGKNRIFDEDERTMPQGTCPARRNMAPFLAAFLCIAALSAPTPAKAETINLTCTNGIVRPVFWIDTESKTIMTGVIVNGQVEGIENFPVQITAGAFNWSNLAHQPDTINRITGVYKTADPFKHVERTYTCTRSNLPAPKGKF